MKFKELRERAGLSQVAVASELGITSAAVSLWESGDTKPRADTLIRLASLYGCSVDDLLRAEVDRKEATV